MILAPVVKISNVRGSSVQKLDEYGFRFEITGKSSRISASCGGDFRRRALDEASVALRCFSLL